MHAVSQLSWVLVLGFAELDIGELQEKIDSNDVLFFLGFSKLFEQFLDLFDLVFTLNPEFLELCLGLVWLEWDHWFSWFEWSE